MRGYGTPLVLRRLGAHRPVIGAAALTTLIAAAAAAALATIGGQVLTQAARHQLTGASATTVALNGTVTAGQAGPATATGPQRHPGRSGCDPVHSAGCDLVGPAAVAGPARPGPTRASGRASGRGEAGRDGAHAALAGGTMAGVRLLPAAARARSRSPSTRAG